MVFGAILAGGIGSRMKMADMPKQFLPLGNKPIIIHTLEKFLLCPRFDAVFIGVNPQWVSHTEELIDKYIGNKSRVRVVPGGADRNGTLFNVVDAIESEFGEDSENVIVTHDAVRPFVTLRILNDNIDAALKYGATDTVICATDTIVVSNDGEKISDIPPRAKMYQGQTPQSFKISKLKEVFKSLTDEEKSSLTDACSIYTRKNLDVYLVKGEVANMKITTVTDYNIVQAMLGCLEIEK
jgi:2-C-methyl-D-erythritol 4-phosphate cytidylyltransferase